jgi:hypothetical protein
MDNQTRNELLNYKDDAHQYMSSVVTNMPVAELSNIEFVYKLMNYSPYGALAQTFIIEAINHYSKTIADSTPRDDSSAFINPKTWHDLAVDIQKQLVEKYEPKPSSNQI